MRLLLICLTFGLTLGGHAFAQLSPMQRNLPLIGTEALISMRGSQQQCIERTKKILSEVGTFSGTMYENRPAVLVYGHAQNTIIEIYCDDPKFGVEQPPPMAGLPQFGSSPAYTDVKIKIGGSTSEKVHEVMRAVRQKYETGR